MPFVIRSQGFFYTDEYYAPAGAWAQVIKKTYATAEEAEDARRTLDRARLRSERPSDYVFDDPKKMQKIVDYLRKALPDTQGDLTLDALYDWQEWPELTDAHLDALLELVAVQFTMVVQWDESEAPSDNDDDDDDAEEDYSMMDDLWFGPTDPDNPNGPTYVIQ